MLICRATHVYLQLKWRYVLLELESINKHWVIKMTRYQEILRLSSMGFSQRSIASSCQCSRNTVSNVLSLANQKDLIWPLPEDVGIRIFITCYSLKRVRHPHVGSRTSSIFTKNWQRAVLRLACFGVNIANACRLS